MFPPPTGGITGRLSGKGRVVLLTNNYTLVVDIDIVNCADVDEDTGSKEEV